MALTVCPSPKMGSSVCPKIREWPYIRNGWSDTLQVFRVSGSNLYLFYFYFRSQLHQIHVGGRPPSWIIANGHISATAHSIHLYSGHRAVIFAIAQLSRFCYEPIFDAVLKSRIPLLRLLWDDWKVCTKQDDASDLTPTQDARCCLATARLFHGFSKAELVSEKLTVL